MTRLINHSMCFAVLVLAGTAMFGCQSDKHTMAEPNEGTSIMCKECYDQVYKEQHYSGSRGVGTVTQTHTRHECPSCKTEMAIYTENGVTKVKCAKCAPAGLACDKCLPPKGWTPPS